MRACKNNFDVSVQSENQTLHPFVPKGSSKKDNIAFSQI